MRKGQMVLKTFISLGFLMLVWLPSFAQTPPPGGATDPGAPFDIISIILLVLGAVYGGFRTKTQGSK